MNTQVRGLSESLGLDCQHKVCKRHRWFSWLPSWFSWGALSTMTQDSDPLCAPWPDILIGCGRRSIPMMLAIKRKHPQTFTIYLQDPKINPSHFDLVISPFHDQLTGDNVLNTHGAIHRVTKAKLAEEKLIQAKYFKGLATPIYSVLLGGSTSYYQLTDKAINSIIHDIEQLANNMNGTVLVTTSRRTGEKNSARLAKHFQNHPRVKINYPEGKNLYFAYLAYADKIIVSEDSVSMASEACYTGKPVYILRFLGFKKPKIERFIQELTRDNKAKILTDKLVSWQPTPLDERTKIASLIKDKLSL